MSFMNSKKALRDPINQTERDVVATLPGSEIESGWRSNEEQGRLHKGGFTRVPAGQSPHNKGDKDNPDAVDLSGYEQSPAGARKAQAALRANGFPDAVVIYESGKGRYRGTGQHLHVQGLTRRGPAGAGDASGPVSAGVNPPDMPSQVDVKSVQPTSGERTAMKADAYPNDATDPFKIQPRIDNQQSTVTQRGNAADQVLSSVTDALQEIQGNRENILTTAVQRKRAINEEVRGNTESILAESRPLFERRNAIKRRQLDLATMSPLERFVKGTFDPAYNSTDLEGQDRAIVGVLAALDDQFKGTTMLQDRLTQLIESDYAGQDSIYKLQRENFGEDWNLASQSYALSQTILGAEMQGLENMVGIKRAQQFARVDTLSKLSLGQVNSALAEAQASPDGVAIVNGVPLTVGELEGSQKGYQMQALDLESRQLAIQGGRMDLADKYEDRLIDHMTPGQIEAAIKNGGVYNGQQLSVGKLTKAYGSLRARQEQQANDIAASGSVGVMKTQIGAMGNFAMGVSYRMESLMGSVPDDQKQLMAGVTAEVAAITEGFKQAEAQGVGAQYAAANAPRLQALYKQQEQMIDRIATRWSGGNEELKLTASAFLRGEPVNAETAIRGVISLSRGGIPPGTQMSPAARDLFRVIGTVVAQADKPGAGTDVNSILSPQDKTARDRALAARVQRVVKISYNDRLLDSVIQSVPQLAAQLKHPAAQINPDSWRRAVRHGDQQGLERLGTELGLKPADVIRMFNEGPGGALWQQIKANKGWDDGQFDVQGQRLTAYQGQSMLQALDADAPYGEKPSRALMSLLNDPRFQQLVSQQVQAQGRSTFGDSLISNVAGGDFMNTFQGYVSSLGGSYAMNDSVATEKRIRQARDSWRQDPIKGTEMVLRGFDNVNVGDRQYFLQNLPPLLAVRRKEIAAQAPSPFRLTNTQADIQSGIASGQDSMNPFYTISDMITNGKFVDPRMEAIRKRIAPQWSEATSRLDRQTSTD